MMPMAHEKRRHTTIPQGMCPCCRLLIRWDMDLQMSPRRIRSGQAGQTQPNAPGHLLEWEQSRRRVVRGSLASLHDTIQLVES